jgi:hypothetical protein
MPVRSICSLLPVNHHVLAGKLSNGPMMINAFCEKNAMITIVVA